MLENTNKKNRTLEFELINTEKRNNIVEKNIQKIRLNRESSKNLIIKILTSKLNMLRTEIEKLKMYNKNEISTIKKDSENIIDLLLNKVKSYTKKLDNDLENNIKRIKESSERELERKLDEKELEFIEEFEKTNKKFEILLIDEQRRSDKQEKEKNHAVS